MQPGLHVQSRPKGVRSRKKLVACHRENEKARSARNTSDMRVQKRHKSARATHEHSNPGCKQFEVSDCSPQGMPWLVGRSHPHFDTGTRCVHAEQATSQHAYTTASHAARHMSALSSVGAKGACERETSSGVQHSTGPRNNTGCSRHRK
jgi:hypothetical protein